MTVTFWSRVTVTFDAGGTMRVYSGAALVETLAGPGGLPGSRYPVVRSWAAASTHWTAPASAAPSPTSCKSTLASSPRTDTHGGRDAHHNRSQAQVSHRVSHTWPHGALGTHVSSYARIPARPAT